jgi:hypothetical protein
MNSFFADLYFLHDIYLPHALHHASSQCGVSLYATTANSADVLKILNIPVGKKFTGIP